MTELLKLKARIEELEELIGEFIMTGRDLLTAHEMTERVDAKRDLTELIKRATPYRREAREVLELLQKRGKLKP